jgi:hypothetical protein
MGGISCDIIVNCGIVKGAAAALITLNKYPELVTAGAQLRDQNDEICRFGEAAAILAIEFTEEQEESIYAGGADAIALTEKIEAFAYGDDSKGVLTAAEMLRQIRTFIAAQQTAFRQLVRELYSESSYGEDSLPEEET